MNSGLVSEREILDRILGHGPFEEEAQARQALTATLVVLGSVLTSDERTALERDLPPTLAPLLTAGLPHPLRDWPTFSRRVADEEGVRVGLAIEHCEVVCRAVSELLPPVARQRLQRSLPALAALFEVPDPSDQPPLEERRSPATSNELAADRPTSSLPIAAADPRYLAHRHSIARSDDPHGDTKLSSAKGSRQEQESRTYRHGTLVPGAQCRTIDPTAISLTFLCPSEARPRDAVVALTRVFKAGIQLQPRRRIVRTKVFIHPGRKRRVMKRLRHANGERATVAVQPGTRLSRAVGNMADDALAPFLLWCRSVLRIDHETRVELPVPKLDDSDGFGDRSCSFACARMGLLPAGQLGPGDRLWWGCPLARAGRVCA